MFPYFELLWINIYMTWIWIIVFLICFIMVTKYLCQKWHQDFMKFFYWLPVAIIITYLMWSYMQFILEVWFIPKSIEELRILISPYWYKFHFVWLLIGFVFSLFLFFKKIKRYETKKIWIDIMFFSLSLSFIPLWIFLVFWDNFIWQTSDGIFALKPLTTDSELNKFNWVYPVWIFLSFASALVTLFIYFLKKRKKSFWYGMFWLILLIIWFNVVFLFQQYPKYWIISFLGMVFDIKHYVSFFVIMFCLHIYYSWEFRLKKSI